MAADWPIRLLYALALLGMFSATAPTRAQTANPLRGAAAHDLWPDRSKATESEQADIDLVDAEEELNPLAPPPRRRMPSEAVESQPRPRWPDGRYATPYPPMRPYGGPPGSAPDFGVSLPPEDPEYDAWQNEMAGPGHPRRNYRFTGWGQPLYGTSWLNRPWYVGAFVGQGFFDDPSADVQQSNAALVGLRLGWDFDYYWGIEGRFSYANTNLTPLGTTRVTGTGRDYFVDVAMMWYPTGDSKWRPFLSAGLGAATYRYQRNGVGIHDTGLEIPLGVGLKYFMNPWTSLRMEAQYAPSFGTQRLDPMNNFALGLGLEIRFGGMPRSYFPWTGSTVYW